MTQPGPLSTPWVWDTVAEGYASDFVPLFSLYAADALALAEIPPNADVLDVAAGPGTLALLAARTARHVTAVDFAEAMVGELERRAAEQGITNVEVRVADGQALPFADATFDAAFSMFGLMFFPDRAAGFRELARVVKPGRRAVVSSWAPAELIPLFDCLFGAFRSLLPDLPFGNGKAPLSEVDEFQQEMSDAGFREVDIRTVEHRMDILSVRAFWESQMRSSAPIALLKSRIHPAEWDALAATLLVRLEDEFGSGPLNVGWPAHLGVGIR